MGMSPAELADLYRSDPDPAPLQGLRTVDWSAVEDAYGPANDVPALLRALMSWDSAHREAASRILHTTIWHQGNVYSASAAAIPFLYNLLEEDGPQDKADVAGLIALIADGRPPFIDCPDDPTEAARWRDILRHSGRSFDAEVAEGRLVAAEVRRQVGQRPELLSEYLANARDE